jgi:beta-lactamase class A
MTTTHPGLAKAEGGLKKLFRARGAEGAVYACDLDGPSEAGLNPDTPVVTASVFKIPVMVELARRATAGELSFTDRLTVAPEQHVMGPTGLSVFSDPVELSWRDLAMLMMSVSDNTATDIIVERLGVERINETMRALGLENTVLVGDCGVILTSLVEDLGVADVENFTWADVSQEQWLACRSLNPLQTTRTTAREMARLLSMIWRDEAGPADACAEVRRIMSLQVWPHRLRAGFPDAVKIAGKTGTLPGIRNEAGVVEYPGGKRYAVAVFTRTTTYLENDPTIDRLIGEAASVAVEGLRVS